MFSKWSKWSNMVQKVSICLKMFQKASLDLQSVFFNLISSMQSWTKFFQSCYDFSELSEIAKQEISKQNTANVEMASDFVKQNFATWIKEEPCLIIQPQNPTTASNPSTENYPGPLGFDVRVEQTGTKSKEAHVMQNFRLSLVFYCLVITI